MTGCDAPLPAVELRTRWSAVFAFGLATLVVASQSSMAAFALPLVSAEFGIGSGTTAWVVLGYSLPLAALALPAGRWVDDADVRMVFAVSLAGVGAASVLTALAPTFWVLVAGRALQGLASALYLAVYLPVVADAVREEQRGRAMSYIQMIMMTGSIAVAPIGGLVAGEFGWRAVFVFKLPILVIVLWWGHRAVPARRMAGRPLPIPPLPLVKDALILGGAVALGLLAIEWAGEAWVLATALAAAAIVAGLLWWRLPTARPVVALMRRPVFGAAAAALALVTSTSGIVIFSLPFFISEVMGRPPEILGVGMVFFVGAAALLAPAAGFLADRFGAHTVAAVGALLTTLAMLNMLGLGPNTGPIDLAWRMAALGAAMGMFNAPAMTALLGAAPEGQEGAAGGVANLARTLGNTTGPAIAALTWTLSGSGAAGFHAGVLLLTACTATALVALLTVRRRTTSSGPRRPSPEPD